MLIFKQSNEGQLTNCMIKINGQYYIWNQYAGSQACIIK